ncbi:MAG: DNA-binding response regulator [Flavobacterium sp.]|uniref:response regulator transcription factor n=1 Tax=unclassified Flavobacterium TaxID=196869 RepID=UPI000C374290|nr:MULTISPECIES: response regulator transcription factor [unclassified Flavobacterium]MBF04598.1 DNA-binding response regulator [Flavobacterium sp.]MCO6162898.1 response regulator transcription factor [Flavobacterium sp. NRK F7]
MKAKKKVIIIDDHLLFSQSLKYLINSFNDFLVVDNYENGKDFIDSVQANKINTDEIELVLLDVNMPVLDGLKTMEWIKNNRDELKVIALSVNDDEETIIKMIKHGAKGYLLKDTSPQIFEEALKTVADKGFFFTELVSGLLVNRLDNNNQKHELKDKEILFIKHACTEKTYKEIADEMCLSPKTIDGYRENLFCKLEIKTRIGLVLYAIKNKIVCIE